MNCELMMEWMQRFVDVDLTQTEEQSLMTHISQCPDCAASFEQLQRLSAELSLLPMVVPPFSIVDSILPRLAELDAQQAAIKVAYLPTPDQRKKPLFYWKIAAAFVAAAAIFGLIAVNLEPISKFDASGMLNTGSASKDTANYEIADAASGSEAAKSETPMAASKDSTVDNFTMNKADTITEQRSGTTDKNPEATVDKTDEMRVLFGDDETAKKSQELAPQPTPSPVPQSAAPTVNDKSIMFSTPVSTPTSTPTSTPAAASASANQTLASDDGNFIGVVEQQIVQVQTPDGNRIYTSSNQWKSTDTIRLLLWQDNQRLTYEVTMEDGQLKRFIINPILKTEQEQKTD
jgi:hypothetical protein